MSRVTAVLLLTTCVLGLLGLTCGAADAPPPQEEQKAEKSDLAVALVALAAALAVGMTAIATGIAQSRIGAAGCGTLAERPETFGTVIVMLALPETMVILGFVVAVVILFAK